MTGSDAARAGRQDLGRRLRVAFAWGACGVVLGRALQFVTTLILARVLMPADFGALAVALVVQSVAVNVTDLGATAAIGRAGRNSSELAPTVLCVSASTGAALTGAILLLAPALSAALGNDSATPVVRVMALTILLAGFSGVPAAFVWRDYRQGPKAAVESLGAAVSLGLAIVMALAGWGAMSLAWSRVGGQFVTTLGYWLIAPVRVRPKFRLADARFVFRLGLPLAAANLVVFLALNIDYAVVGRVLGPELLGYYLLAFTLSGIPSTLVTTAIRSVAVPSLGRLHAAGMLGDAAPSLLNLVCCLAMPIAAVVTASAGPLVSVLYGASWAQAAIPLIGLGVFSGGRILTEFLADLCVGAARTIGLFWIQVIWFSVLLPAIWFASLQWGLFGVGIAQAVVVWTAVLPVYILTAARGAGIGVLRLARSIARPLFASAFAGLLVASLTTMINGDIPRLLFDTAVGGVVCLAILLRPARSAWHIFQAQLSATNVVTEGSQL